MAPIWLQCSQLSYQLKLHYLFNTCYTYSSWIEPSAAALYHFKLLKIFSAQTDPTFSLLRASNLPPVYRQIPIPKNSQTPFFKFKRQSPQSSIPNRIWQRRSSQRERDNRKLARQPNLCYTAKVSVVLAHGHQPSKTKSVLKGRRKSIVFSGRTNLADALPATL